MNTKVRVIKEFKQMAEVLPLGFETELIPQYTTEDKITKGFWTTDAYKKPVWVPDVLTPKGTFTTLSFVGANGETYNDKWIQYCIGYKPLSDVFKKI